ncbi:hypothetical protein ACFV1N_20520 [Streptosporangium canum]|uniref:hypothetical protein n=1 Tax=Streptosporangium canum TaxID=324952 RepID=UPI0036BBC9F6
MPLTEDALLYLGSAQVAALCRQIDPLQVVTDAFAAVQNGQAGVTAEAALRWSAADGSAARSLILPAWHDDTYGCKIINACIGNIDRGLPRAHGLMVLYDSLTAAPVCIMEGAHISALRTAAVSVAAIGAVRGFAGLHHLALLGCGRQSRTHLHLLAERCPNLTQVSLYDSDPDRGARLVEYARRLLPGSAITLAPDAEAAVSAAQVTIAATTTTTPYVPAQWLPAGATFVNVSLDDATQELLLECDHLFVDDWSLVAGDEHRLLGRLARARHVVGPHDAPLPGARQVNAELATVLSGAYSRPITATDRVVVNPFGMGVHDVALAVRIYAAARDHNDDAGTWLPR